MFEAANLCDATLENITKVRFHIIRCKCKKCGITDRVKVFKTGEEREDEKWEHVSSHTARRMCATLLYIRGADIYTISKILGHSATTQNHIKADIRTDSEELRGYII